MSDNTMPEHIIAGYGFHGYEWSLPDSVMAYRLESVTEYINADALRAKLGGYHDSDLLSLAESLRTFHDNHEATMERLLEQLHAANARITERENAIQSEVYAERMRADGLRKQIDELEAWQETAQRMEDANQLQRQVIATQKQRIAELEAVQRWVSVDERLPEPLTDVLVTDGESVATGWASKNVSWMINGWSDEGITHWMPLPPPPVTPET